MKPMKNYLLFLFFIAFSSSGLAKSPARSKLSNNQEPAMAAKSERDKFRLEGLAPSAREELARLVSVTLLHETQAHLEAFFEHKDEKALSALLEPWSAEERLEITKELMSISEKPKLRVENTSMFIVLKDGEFEFKVEDPFEGLFRINGQALKIDPLSKYRFFKEKFNQFSEISSYGSPFFRFFETEANAGVSSLLVKKAAAAMLKPTTAAVGGAVKAKALPQAARITGSFVKRPLAKAAAAPAPRSFWRDFWGREMAVQVRNNAVGSMGAVAGLCIIFATDLKRRTNGCKDFAVQTLCIHEMRKEGCVNSVGDLKPEIEQATATTPPIVVVEPVNGGKCQETKNGLAKDVNVNLVNALKTKQLRAQNKNASFPPPMETVKIHLEYDKNPTDPKKLKLKTITQVVKSEEEPTKGEIIETSIWRYDGDNWTIETYTPNTTSPKDAKSMYLGLANKNLSTISCDAKNPSEECKAQSGQLASTLKDEINCKQDNAAAVINEIKSENQGGKR
jgi:hypothetical protein